MPRKSQKQTKASKNNSSMKYEIANELGVNMGPNASSKANGSVGGEMTKRLVKMGEEKYNSKSSK